MQTKEEKLQEIIRLGVEFNRVQDLDLLLDCILGGVRHLVEADAGSIYIKEGGELIFSHVHNQTLADNLPKGQPLVYKRFRIEINDRSIAGYVANHARVLNIDDVYAVSPDLPYRFNSSFDDVSGYKTKAMLTVPLKAVSGQVLGVLQLINPHFSSSNSGVFDGDDMLVVEHFAAIACAALERSLMTRSLVLRMNSMARLRDPKETGGHVIRVAAYAVELYRVWAKRQNISPEVIDKNTEILRIAAMLHDVGKVAIADAILKKPGKLTDEEFDVMKTHTVRGAELFALKMSDFDEAAAMVALTHHENWDGSGYPGCYAPDGKDHGPGQRLCGQDIPLYGRLVAIADVFDALMSKRSYKQAWTQQDSLCEMKKMSGSKFDPELIDIFVSSFPAIMAIFNKYADEQ